MALSESGPLWQRRPDADQAERNWRIKRAPEKGRLELVVLSHDLIGTLTHFWGGRTVPHTQGPCNACDAGQRVRWHGYFCAWDLKWREKLIIEITANVCQPFDDYFREHRTLRGAICELSRTNDRKNGVVRAKLSQSDYPADRIPNYPPLQPMLERMWGVVSQEPIEPGELIQPTVFRPTLKNANDDDRRSEAAG